MSDGIAYLDKLEQQLKDSLTGIRALDFSRLRLKEGFLKRMVTFARPRSVYLVAEGMITSGHSHKGRGRWPVLDSETLIAFLQDARWKRKIKAIVNRINSPGGSGVAFVLVWREVHQTARKKLLILSFGNIAASGGYYIATSGTEILASSSTLTGSIGVIGRDFTLKRPSEKGRSFLRSHRKGEAFRLRLSHSGLDRRGGRRSSGSYPRVLQRVVSAKKRLMPETRLSQRFEGWPRAGCGPVRRL